MKPALLLAVALLAAACGLGTDDLGQETGDLTTVGPHATNASVRIVYPEPLPALAADANSLVTTWNAGVAAIENAPRLEAEAGAVAGDPDIVAEDPRSGIAIDVVTTGSTVDAAQLTIVDGAGSDDDASNIEALRLFLTAVGIDADAVIETVGSDPDELHADDQDIEGTFRGDGATVFYAANEDTVLVGVFGPWDG